MSLVKMEQVYTDKTATTLKPIAIVASPVHVVFHILHKWLEAFLSIMGKRLYD